MWGVIIGGKYNNIVYIGKIKGSWKWGRGTAGSFFWSGNTINGHGKGYLKLFNTIIWKRMSEPVM